VTALVEAFYTTHAGDLATTRAVVVYQTVRARADLPQYPLAGVLAAVFI